MFFCVLKCLKFLFNLILILSHRFHFYLPSPVVVNDILGQLEWFIMKIHHYLQHLQPILNINSFPKFSTHVLI